MPPIEYFGVMIPILGILLGFFGVWLSHKQKLAAMQIRAAQPRTASGEQAEQIRELQDRVQVLERIVTDGGYDLAHKIEALRDERAVPVALDKPTEVERLG